MEGIIKIFGFLFGVLTALLALLKAVLEIRKQFQEDKTLSDLLDSPKFRNVMIIMLVGIIVAIGAVLWSTQSQYKLTVEIWENTPPYAMIDSRQFSGIGNEIANKTLIDAGIWITEAITQRDNLSGGPLQLYVHVPANWSKEKLDILTTPPLPFKVYYWYILKMPDNAYGNTNSSRTESETLPPVALPSYEPGIAGKARIPISEPSPQSEKVQLVNERALEALHSDFYLEIDVPSFWPWSEYINWSLGFEERTILETIPLSVNVQKFVGENNSIDARLRSYLSQDRRFSIEEPGNYELPSFPLPVVTQVALLPTQGSDVVIRGYYEKTQSLV
jgi:hypothetical protein